MEKRPPPAMTLEEMTKETKRVEGVESEPIGLVARWAAESSAKGD